MTLQLAHAGHWALNLLYLAPVILISIALWRSDRKNGKETADEQSDRDRDQEASAAAEEP